MEGVGGKLCPLDCKVEDHAMFFATDFSGHSCLTLVIGWGVELGVHYGCQ